MDLADTILDPDPPSAFRMGVVQSPFPLTVRVGASANAVVCRRLSSYMPAAFDSVVVLVTGGDRVVLGTTQQDGAEIKMNANLAYFSWWNGATRQGYLQGHTGGMVLNAEVGTLNFISADGRAYMPGQIRIGNSPKYGGWTGVHFTTTSDYLIMTNAADTLVSTPSATGSIMLRPGQNDGNAFIVQQNGNHQLIGSLNMSNGSIGNSYNVTINNALYFGSTYVVGAAESPYGLHVHPGVNTGINLRLGEFYTTGGVYCASGSLYLSGNGETRITGSVRDPRGMGSLRVDYKTVAAFTAGGSGSWNDVQIECQDNGTGVVGITMRGNNYAWSPTMRMNPGGTSAQRIDFVDSANAYTRIQCLAVDQTSTERSKRDVSVIDDGDTLDRLASIELKQWLPLTDTPMQMREGVDDDEHEAHDCSRHDCHGTGKRPCALVRNHIRGSLGMTAEGLIERYPEHVYIGHDGKPEGIDIGQVAGTALGSAAALLRHVRKLEARLAALEGV